MSWQVRFTPLADSDVVDTYAWYESAQPQLGEDFLRDVARAIALVVAHPEGCPDVHRGLRRALLHRFPYSLYYRLSDADRIIEIRACLHQSRHPRNWRRRA